MYALYWPLETLLSIYKTVIIGHWKTKMFNLLMKTYKYKLQTKKFVMYNTNSYRPVKYENEEWAATDISQRDLDFLFLKKYAI